MRKHFLFALLLVGLSVASYGQDIPLDILEQPKPELPKNYGMLDAQGTINLQVEFLADGKVGKIQVVSGMPVRNLTELAVEAAKNIKFNPEIKDGTPINVSKIIQYSYSWKEFWQVPTRKNNQADTIIAKAVQILGGDRYLQIKTQIGRGKFSVIKEGVIVSFQSFVDVIVFPDKERTDFKGRGSRTIQVNTGTTGWLYDGDQDLIKVQNGKQIADFKQSIRTSLDNLLHGHWKGEAELSYVGKRPATLGKRNDVVKLTYKDGFTVEFEFASDDGLPQKSLYKRTDTDGEEVKEEDRYAQFLDTGGVKTPFIVDRWANGKQSSRINYETVEFNKAIPDSIFTKPSKPKDAKKDLKL